MLLFFTVSSLHALNGNNGAQKRKSYASTGAGAIPLLFVCIIVTKTQAIVKPYSLREQHKRKGCPCAAAFSFMLNEMEQVLVIPCLRFPWEKSRNPALPRRCRPLFPQE